MPDAFPYKLPAEPGARVLTVHVGQDHYPRDPNEDHDGWHITTFERNGAHSGYMPKGPGTRQQLKHGTAFLVSCYRHGGDQWGLQGEVFQCRWDTAQLAGILVWKGGARSLPRDLEARKDSARAWLRHYSAWRNNEIYLCRVKDVDDGEEVYVAEGRSYSDLDLLAAQARCFTAGYPVRYEDDETREVAERYDLGGFPVPTHTETDDGI